MRRSTIAKTTKRMIEAVAGVGRVTLYGHFASREELIDVLFERTIDRAEAQLSELDLAGDPEDALELLVRSSWRIVDSFPPTSRRGRAGPVP